MEMTGDEDWQRFGRVVVARRKRLGLTQDGLAERGGPSVATLRTLENGAAFQPRAGTLRALNDALGWPPASIQRLLYDDDPERVAAELISAPDRFGSQSPRTVRTVPTDSGEFTPEEARRFLARVIARAEETAGAPEPNLADIEARLVELRGGLLDIQRTATSLVTTIDQVITSRALLELDQYRHGSDPS